MPIGKISNDGRDWLADHIQMGLDLSGTPTNDLSFIEMGTGAPDVNITAVTDISVDAVERSYNSTVTDFVAEGIVVGMVIPVTGFTDVNNNLSAEVLSVSVNKIRVQENITLVTEVAGDAITITGYNVTETDTTVKTPLASGGRIAADAGWPKIVISGNNRTLQTKATFTAGSFTTGTAITEAVMTNSLGTVSGGRTILDASKNPSPSEPLEIIINFPLIAG